MMMNIISLALMKLYSVWYEGPRHSAWLLLSWNVTL